MNGEPAASQRLFFGLWPDEPLRQAIHAAVKPWLSGLDARPVPVCNYHLTLAYLGDVELARVPAIEQAVAAIDWSAFELVLDRLGHWRRAGVVWLAPAEVPAALSALVDGLWHALGPLGFVRDARAFAPHLTLARKLRRRPPPATVEPPHWPVSRFALFESCAVPGGVEYRVVKQFRAGSRPEP